MYRRLTHSNLPAILVCLILSATAWSQVQIQVGQPGKPPVFAKPMRNRTEEQMLIERARATEQRGDYERALLFWREVLNRSPWNPEALNALPRNLIVLKRYDEAESFLRDLLQKSELEGQMKPLSDPSSPYALTLLLGQVTLARGEEDKAWEIWNGALKQYPNNAEAVHLLVLTLQQNRRWEESEKMIRDYRKSAKEPAFMALELANSLRGQMNFAPATEELLLYTESTPAGWQIAQNYLNQFPDDSTIAEKVSATLKKAVQRDRKNGTLWRLYAGYLLKAGDLNEFLNATITADSLTDGNGAQVLQAAQSLLNEGMIDLARRGFQRLLAWKASPQVTARAELGLGLCLESLGQWSDAKHSYEAFVDKNPRLKEVDEARLRIADILLQHERNPQDALTIYTSLWTRGAGFPRAPVGLRIGDAQAWMGHYDQAISAWSDVVQLYGAQINEDAATALLRIARANFWRDSVSAAYVALDSIQSSPTGNTAFNDAVLYSALLDEQGFYRAVRAFAEADYATFRHEDSLAAVRFEESANLLKSGRMAEWARFSQALALRNAGRSLLAIAVLDTFLQNYPESVDLDRAKYTQALIRMEDLHDNATALKELQQFLIDHPRSMYLEQARRKARLLTNKVS